MQVPLLARRALRAGSLPVPAVSVGNCRVGGAGRGLGRRLSAAALIAAALLAPNVAVAQDKEPHWLLGLEELMQVEVTTASRREQPVANTAASVFVLTRDDIRRSGLSTVPDLLRLVPGVQVAQIDGNKWALSIRGFNSRWANKLQVMIDGRSVYTDVFAGVYWDALDVQVDTIERIEVIRGPGGSLWGANAVNGVVNIITRVSSARGGVLTGGLGSQGLSSTSARYSLPVGNRVLLNGYASSSDRGAVYANSNDAWRQVRFGGGISVQVSAHDTIRIDAGGMDSETDSIGTDLVNHTEIVGIPRPRRTDLEAFRSGVQWTHTDETGGRFEAAANLASTDRRDDLLPVDSLVVDAGLQHSPARRGRHQLTWGLTLRQSRDAVASTPTFRIALPTSSVSRFGVFVQDELPFARDRVVLSLGTKVERFTDTGWHAQPSVRLRWHPSASQTLWAAVSRAVRTPSLIERGIEKEVYVLATTTPRRVGVVTGNPDASEESLAAYEAGYRRTTRILSVDLSGYYSRYRDLLNAQAGAPSLAVSQGLPRLIVPLMFGNNTNASATGGEALLTVSPLRQWRIVGGYGLFTTASRTDPGVRAAVVNFNAKAPRHQGVLRSLLALPGGVDADASVYLVGRLRSSAYVVGAHSPDIPAYAQVDGRLAWRAHEKVDLSVLVQDALDSRHLEFEGDTAFVVASPVRRRITAAATWRF